MRNAGDPILFQDPLGYPGPCEIDPGPYRIEDPLGVDLKIEMGYGYDFPARGLR